MKDYKIQTFSNGATIVLKPVKSLKYSAVSFGFKTGAILDEILGTAHFLEHNLFLGTENRTHDQIDRDNAEICELNALTSLYYTMVRFKRANSELEAAFEFSSDILLNTKFNNNEIKKEREVVRNEILMIKDRDKRNIYSYHNSLWSPYVNRTSCVVIGEDIDKITKKDLVKYRDKNYHSKNFIMYVLSSLPMSKFVSLYKKYIVPNLKILKESEPVNYDMSPKKTSALQVIVLEQDKVDVILSINIPFGIYNTKNRLCRVFLSDYLNIEQPYNTLRKKGLVYASSAYITEWAYNSILNIKFVCLKDNINKIIDEYAKEMQNLYNSGMDEAKFKNICKQVVIAEDETERDFSLNEVEAISFTHITRGLVDKLDIKKEAKNITLEEVNKYIKLFNNPNNEMWVTVMGKVTEGDIYTLSQLQKKFYTNIKN